MAENALEIAGLPSLTRDLTRAGELIGSPRPILNQVGALMKGQIGKTFAAGADPVTGVAWKPLTPFTLANRRGGGGGAKPLRDTSRLFNSLVSAIPKVTQDTVSIATTNVVYAGVHQYGAVIVPREASVLAIPVAAESRGKRARLWWQQNAAKNPFIRFDGARGFIGYMRAGQVVRVYVLMDRVTIPQRRFLGFGKAYADEIEAFVAARILATMKAQPGGAGNGLPV